MTEEVMAKNPVADRGRKFRDAQARQTRDEMERQMSAAPKMPPCINTTIQGMPVTLMKCGDETCLSFTVASSAKAGEITEAEFMAAYGSQDDEFVYGLMHQLANVGYSRSGCPDVEGFRFALADVRGMAPRDTLEAKICAQMFVVHSSAMKVAKRLAQAEELAEIERLERSLNRLLRTFCALAAALDRHRNRDRKIAVQQGSIAEGDARAIVGDIHQHGVKARGKRNGHASA